jgi:DNA-binding response OmpR family regulator
VSNRECVLVVDEIPDTAEVLEAVLALRGLTVNRVRHLDAAHPLTLANRPALIVVDVESCASPNTRACDGWQNVPQVIIGTMQAPAAGDDVPPGEASDRRYLQKPFQFAELIQAIDALIAGDRRHVFRSGR